MKEETDWYFSRLHECLWDGKKLRLTCGQDGPEQITKCEI